MFSLGQPREFQPIGRAAEHALVGLDGARDRASLSSSRPYVQASVQRQPWPIRSWSCSRIHSATAGFSSSATAVAGHGDGHAGLVEDPGQPPHAGAAAVLVVRLGAGVALRRLHARVGVLAPAVVAVVAPHDGVLRALLVDQHQVDDDVGAAGPGERRRGAAVADQVARPDGVGDHAASRRAPARVEGRVGDGSGLTRDDPVDWYAILHSDDVSRHAQRDPAGDRLADRAVRLGVGDQRPHVRLRRGRLDAGVQLGVGQVVARPVAPGEAWWRPRVSISPSGISRARAMPVSVEVKQLASAAENSSSGFDSPPGPPSSAWVAVATDERARAALDPAVEAVPAKRCGGVERAHRGESSRPSRDGSTVLG